MKYLVLYEDISGRYEPVNIIIEAKDNYEADDIATEENTLKKVASYFEEIEPKLLYTTRLDKVIEINVRKERRD